MKYYREFNHGAGVETIIEETIRDCLSRRFLQFFKNRTLIFRTYLHHLLMESVMVDLNEEAIFIIGECGLQAPLSKLIKEHWVHSTVSSEHKQFLFGKQLRTSQCRNIENTNRLILVHIKDTVVDLVLTIVTFKHTLISLKISNTKLTSAVLFKHSVLKSLLNINVQRNPKAMVLCIGNSMMLGQLFLGLVSTTLEDGNLCSTWLRDYTLMWLCSATVAKLSLSMTICTLSRLY